jgi:hypothetical protein
MWKKIEQQLTKIDKATGIELALLPDGKVIYNAVTLNLKKNSASKEGEWHFIDSLETLTKELTTETPIVLVINGKGVLTKKIPAPTLPINPIGELLPNANPAEFYYQTTQYDKFGVASIVRKEIVDQVVQQFREKNYKVLQVFLGFCSSNTLLTFLKAEPGSFLATNFYQLQLNGRQTLADFSTKEFSNKSFEQIEYPVANQYVKSNSLLSFGAALQLLTDDIQRPPLIAVHGIEEERKEYRLFKFFKAALWGLLIFVFASLLISFLLYNNYFSRNKELQLQQNFSKEKTDQLLLSGKQLKNKENFLLQAGWNQSGKISFYADRIANFTPYNTLLTKMEIYPLKTNVNSAEGGMRFKKDTIVVAGTCENPTEINQLVNNLKAIKEFKEVNVKNYQYKKEAGTGVFTVELITY